MARPLKPFSVSTGALRTQVISVVKPVNTAWSGCMACLGQRLSSAHPLQGVLFCIIAAIVASVLPVLSYIFVSLPRGFTQAFPAQQRPACLLPASQAPISAGQQGPPMQALDEDYRGKIDMYVHWGVVGVACILVSRHLSLHFASEASSICTTSRPDRT